MSLYQELKIAGVPLDSHESDLYFQATAEGLRILDRFAEKKTASFFTSQIDGKRWVDVPFAFEPWWERRARKAVAK